MRYDFVERHRGRWPVRLMCRVLRVSPGGDYDWRGRPPSIRAARHDALVVSIKAIYDEVKARYGSPRIHAELVARGVPCCVNTVARLMRQEGIAAKTKRKFRVTTDSNHDRPVAENVLDRRFEPGAPNQAWTADITSVATSVVSHSDAILSSTALARRTFSRMSSALAVHTNGRGLSLCSSI
jgi:putative transposase